MKNHIRICTYQFIIGIFLLLVTSCSKDNTSTPDLPKTGVPIVTTVNSTTTPAFFGGIIVSDGGSSITMKGICWNTSPNPIPSNNKIIPNVWTGTNSFNEWIYGILPNTTYYVRAFATNSTGTGYGNEISFTTGQLPSITTTPISNINALSATSGGIVSSIGNNAVTARGVCWSTTANPLVTGDHTTDGSGMGAFSSTLTGLTQKTIYYVRSYATNSDGTTYGNQLTFTTLNSNPTIPAYKTTLLYSGANIIEEDKFQWNTTANTWVNYSKITYTYDSLGHKTGSNHSIWDNNKWVNDWKYVYSNFLYGEMWTTISYQWNLSTLSWGEFSKDDNFRTDGYIPNTVYLTHYAWSSSNWEYYNDYMFTVTLDSKGRITQEISDAYVDYLHGYYGARYKILYKYDSIGNIIDYQWSNYDSIYGWSDTGVISSFTYDAFGNPIQKLIGTWSSALNIYVSSKIIYTYTGGLQTEYIEYTN